MCHFCPVEIKSLGLGSGGFLWFCCCFWFFALHIGSSTLETKKTNMAFAKQCIMKTWASSIALGVQQPAIFQAGTKQTKINTIYALNRESYAFQKTFLKTFKLYKKQTLVKCKLLKTKDKTIWMTQASLSTSTATEQVSPPAVIAEVLLDCLQN